MWQCTVTASTNSSRIKCSTKDYSIIVAQWQLIKWRRYQLAQLKSPFVNQTIICAIYLIGLIRELYYKSSYWINFSFFQQIRCVHLHFQMKTSKQTLHLNSCAFFSFHHNFFFFWKIKFAMRPFEYDPNSSSKMQKQK